VLTAVGAATIAAIITAIAQPLITKFIRDKARIVVTISHYPYRAPSLLREALDEYRRGLIGTDQYKPEVHAQLFTLPHSEGFSEVKVENRSKRGIDGLFLELENNFDFFAEITSGGSVSDTKYGKSCEIGTLRANSQCTILLWTRQENTHSFFGSHKNAIKISANDYDKLSIRFPPPRYISKSYYLIPRLPLWASALVAATLSILATVLWIWIGIQIFGYPTPQ